MHKESGLSVKAYVVVGLCALVSQACGGSGNPPMPTTHPSPTSSMASPTPTMSLPTGSPLPTPTPVPEACRFPDPPIAWAVAQRIQDAPPYSGLVLRLDFETLSWSPVKELAGLNPAGISFVDCEWGWMVGRTVIDEFNTRVPSLYRTTDGGASWSDQIENIDQSTFVGGYFLEGIRCVSRDRCLAFGTRPVGPDIIVDSPPLILLSDDGGETWKASPIAPAPAGTPGGNLRNASIFRLCLTSSGIGLAAGFGASGSLTLLTDDGGYSWRDITAATVGDVACFGEMGLWSVNRDQLNRSTDGGLTWTDMRERLPASVAQAGVSVPPSFIDSRTGWLLARLPSGIELVLNTTDGGENWIELAELPQVPNTILASSLLFATTTFGITSGQRTDNNTIDRFASGAITTDGGKTWTLASFEPDVLRLKDLAAVP